MSDRATLDVEEGGFAHLRLVWAESRNGIDPLMVEQVGDAVDRCRDGIRALLISAEGPAFTVGGDLKHFTKNADRIGAVMGEMIPPWHDTLTRLAELEAPVVCAVHGAIAGGGLGLAYASDVVIAAEGTKFATGFGRIGLSGDGGSTWWLPRMVGLRRAQEMILGGRVLDAAEALEWGLVTTVLPAEEVHPAAERLARGWAAGPTTALATQRRLLRQSADASLEAGLQAETAAMVQVGLTADAREGITSFIERREPRFTGR